MSIIKKFCFGVSNIIAVDIYDNHQMDLMDFGFQLIVECSAQIECIVCEAW